MCTVSISFKPGESIPLILTNNRDEFRNRPWKAPHQYWLEHPTIIAGQDNVAGGTWLGINRFGVISTILNRSDNDPTLQNKKTRGNIPLKALQYKSSIEAIEAIKKLDFENYQSFNLIVADNSDAFWIKYDSQNNEQAVQNIQPGLSMIAAHELNDLSSPRIENYITKFNELSQKHHNIDDLERWKDLILDPTPEDFTNSSKAFKYLNIRYGKDYGTTSSSILYLTNNNHEIKTHWLFNDNPNQQKSFKDLTLF